MEVKLGERKAFNSDKAAYFGGPYSQAIIHNGLIYLSGQGALNPETNQILHGTIEEETEVTMDNIRIIMEEAGSSLNNLLQLRVYLADIRDYGRFNDVYRKYFHEDPPARSCIQAAKLPFGMRIEIDAIGCI